MSGDILLVAMPWEMLEFPSIQLGTLEALLRREGLPVRSRSAKLPFLLIDDHRAGLEGASYTLAALGRRIYEACEHGATPERVLHDLQESGESLPPAGRGIPRGTRPSSGCSMRSGDGISVSQLREPGKQMSRRCGTPCPWASDGTHYARRA